MKAMSRDEREAREPGAGRPRREFSKAEIRRMIDACAEASDKDVARRFSISVSTLQRLIGKRAS